MKPPPFTTFWRHPLRRTAGLLIPATLLVAALRLPEHPDTWTAQLWWTLPTLALLGALQAALAPLRWRRDPGATLPHARDLALLAAALLPAALATAALATLPAVRHLPDWPLPPIALALAFFAPSMLLRPRRADTPTPLFTAGLAALGLLALTLLLGPTLLLDGAYAPKAALLAAAASALTLPHLLPHLARRGEDRRPRRSGARRVSLHPDLTLDDEAHILHLPGHSLAVLPDTRLTLRDADPHAQRTWTLRVEHPSLPQPATFTLHPEREDLHLLLHTLLRLQRQTRCTLHAPWGLATQERPYSLPGALRWITDDLPDLRYVPCPGLLPGATDTSAAWALPRLGDDARDPREDDLNDLEAACAASLVLLPLLPFIAAARRRLRAPVRLALTPHDLTVEGHTFPLHSLRILSALPLSTAPILIADDHRLVLLEGLTDPDARRRFAQHLLLRILAAQGDEEAQRRVAHAGRSPHPAYPPPPRRSLLLLGLGVALLSAAALNLLPTTSLTGIATLGALTLTFNTTALPRALRRAPLLLYPALLMALTS